MPHFAIEKVYTLHGHRLYMRVQTEEERVFEGSGGVLDPSVGTDRDISARG